MFNGFIRVTTIIAVLFGAVVAAWTVYVHGYHLALSHHQGDASALYPGTIEGLIYSSSMVLLDHARRAVPAPRLAKWVLAIGILATLVANVWFGWTYGPATAVISAWPAVALVLSYEMFMQIIRAHRIVAEEEEAKAVEQWTFDPPAHLDEVLQAVAPPPKPAFAGVNGSSRPKAEAPAQPERARHAKGHPTVSAAEREFYREIQRGEVPSIAEIQRRLRVGNDKARSYQAHFKQVGRIYREQVTA